MSLAMRLLYLLHGHLFRAGHETRTAWWLYSIAWNQVNRGRARVTIKFP